MTLNLDDVALAVGNSLYGLLVTKRMLRVIELKGSCTQRHNGCFFDLSIVVEYFHVLKF